MDFFIFFKIILLDAIIIMSIIEDKFFSHFYVKKLFSFFRLAIIFLKFFQSLYFFLMHIVILISSLFSFYICLSDNSVYLFLDFSILLCWFHNIYFLYSTSLLCSFDNKLFHSSFTHN